MEVCMASERFFRIEMLPALHGDCLFVEYGDAARTRRRISRDSLVRFSRLPRQSLARWFENGVQN